MSKYVNFLSRKQKRQQTRGEYELCKDKQEAYINSTIIITAL